MNVASWNDGSDISKRRLAPNVCESYLAGANAVFLRERVADRSRVQDLEPIRVGDFLSQSVVEQVALGLRDGGVVGAKIMPIAVTSGHPRALVEILEMSFLFEADRQLSKWITVPLGSKSYALVDVLGALGIHQVAIDGRSSWRDLARILATNIESIRKGYSVHGEAHLAQLAEEATDRRTSKSLAHSATTQQRVEFQKLKDEAARLKDEKLRTNKRQSSD